MIRRIKQEKAISLIALVITIIVLLILATISIAMLTGQNGLIKKGEIAKEETKKAEYEEILKTIGLGLKPDKVIEKLSSKEYMDRYQEEIEKKEEFKKAIVTRKDDETILVQTEEGYVYEITEDKVEYIGKQGEDVPPDLQESDIELIAKPSEWTKTEVKVEIKTKIEGYTLQYSKDGKTWNNYTTAVTMTDNGAIYARLWDRVNGGGYATGNVTNIDRLPPNVFTPMATSTSNSITLSGSTSDVAKTETDGCSGINRYYFSCDNGATWLPSGGQAGTSYTFSGLTQNKTYSLKMKAVDKAGNETVTNTVSKETTGVPGLGTGNVTFSYNPSGWTKGNVAVTINTTTTGYTLQYSKDGKTWSNYTTAVTMTDNGAIYARLWDGVNGGGYATGNVTNIDRLAPNQFTPTATSTTNSITLSGSTSDAAKTATDGSSGIAKYYFSNDNGATWLPSGGQTGTSYTFSGLTQNTTYNLKMKAVDKVGNERVTSTVSKATIKIPGLSTSNVTFSYNPSGWTKGNVAVTISTTITGYTLQYSKDGQTWSNYTTAVTMTNNGAIYARLKDSTGQVGGTATGNVTKIDKTLPTAGIKAGGVSNKTVTITATGSDNQSGVATYQFYVGGTLKSTQNSTAGSATYQYTTTFGSVNAYVVVKDKAGNTKQSSTITITDNTIKTLAELKTFRDRVNAGNTYQGVTVTQIANINIGGSAAGNWTPIGTDAHRFNGTYNGGNYTISGLYISHTTGAVGNRGLFGVTDSSSYIKNLTISNASVTTISRNSAIVVGFSRGTIENVKVVGGTVKVGANGAAIAGVTGAGKITSCSNSATVTYTSTVSSGENEISAYSIGGIVGEQWYGTTEKCMNTGTIIGAHGAGGIVGSTYNGTIQLCVNKGAVNGNKVTDYGIVGGIAGFVSWNGTSNILNCYNSGKVTSANNAGGITGDCCGNGGKTTIKNCYNIGTISGNIKGGIISGRNEPGEVTCSNNYWLSTCGVSSGAGYGSNGTGMVSKTAAQLKALASTLGSAYKVDSNNINGGYPILTWQ